MKFNKLTLQGFGPFRAKQVIDFAALGEHGLFMISGPTGSGKSAILDAICFALYGETTSQGQGSGAVDGREAGELRCSRCAADDPTEVELEFTSGGVHYKVTRNPAYKRTNKRGTGLTEEKATAALAQQPAGAGTAWEDLESRKISDVNERIQSVTGLTVEQFRRVIILPQGRFRDVLIADYDTREEMLKRIFGTEIYERFERTVDARCKATSATCATHEQRLKVLLQTQPWAESVDRTIVDIESARRIESAQATLHSADVEKTAVESALATKNQALGKANELTKLVQDVTDARSALETAQQRSTDAQFKRAELLAARSATLPKEKLEGWRTQANELKKVIAAQPAVIAAQAAAQEQLIACTSTKDVAESAHAGAAPMRVTIGEINARLAEFAKQRTARDQAAVSNEQAAKEFKKAIASQAACDTGVKVCEKNLADDESALRDANEQFARGVAARLARTLADDAPCPVCGSTNHPKLAQATEDVVEQEALDELGLEVESQRAALDRAQKQLAAVAVARAKAQADLAAAKTALTKFGALEDDSVLTAQRASIMDAISKFESELTRARSAYDTASRSAIAAQQAVSVSHDAGNRLQKAEAATRDAFSEALTESALANAEAVESAWRANAAIAGLEKELHAIDTTMQRCASSHETLDTQLAGRSAPNMQGLQAEVDALKARAKSADAIIVAQTTEVSQLTQFKGNFTKGLSQLTKSEADFKTDSNLHKLVTGGFGGAQRLSLHGWVLGSVLDRVLATASEMMRPLSSGRYELVRGVGVQDKRIAAGLDIEVFDNHTGHTRAARTLSGGETFLASLSLALALAEVAQAYHGARPLDTVFIDEGFGALDSDTLDTAMKALANLHSKGRIVGIISHVEEVKRQIPRQLHVTRDPMTKESRVG